MLFRKTNYTKMCTSQRKHFPIKTICLNLPKYDCLPFHSMGTLVQYQLNAIFLVHMKEHNIIQRFLIKVDDLSTSHYPVHTKLIQMTNQYLNPDTAAHVPVIILACAYHIIQVCCTASLNIIHFILNNF